MFHLLEYKIYSMTSRSLPNCYRDEINDENDNNVANNRINNNKTITSKYFKYKTKLIASTPNNNSVTAQKKYISFFQMFQMVFPKKSHWNTIFLVLSGEIVSFSGKYIFHLDGK